MPSNIRPLRSASTAKPQLDPLDSIALVELKRGLRAKGWTLEQFARAAGIDKSTAWRALSGRSRVTGAMLVAVGAIANQNEKAA